MARFPVSLKSREEIAAGTWMFTLGLDRHPFSFEPGQAIDLFLVDPPHADPRGPQHAFTIAGAAGAEAIQIATRIRDSVYKKNLLEMRLGSRLEVDGPWGDFTL